MKQTHLAGISFAYSIKKKQSIQQNKSFWGGKRWYIRRGKIDRRGMYKDKRALNRTKQIQGKYSQETLIQSFNYS